MSLMIRRSDRLPEGTVTLLFTDIEGSTRLLQRLQEAGDHGMLKTGDPGWRV